MPNFIQANLNRARAAQALIMQTMHDTQADVAIISEPNKIPNEDGWYGSTDLTCCLYVDADTEVTRSGSGHGFAWIETAETRVYSCYYSPNKRHTIDDYKVYLNQLEESVRRGPPEVIVAGDFNAHSPSWGSPNTCAKGEALTDIVSSLGLIVVNNGNAPTFERGGQESHIDVTLASTPTYRNIRNWKVLEVDIASDHHPIYFSTRETTQPVHNLAIGWSWRRMDEAKLEAYLRSYTHPEEQDVFDADGLGKFLEAACDSCMPRRSARPRKKAVHWWTEDIAALRKASFKARRIYQKACKRSRSMPAGTPEFQGSVQGLASGDPTQSGEMLGGTL